MTSDTTGRFGLLPVAVMGCLRNDGRERLLENLSFQSEDQNRGVSEAAVAGTDAALVDYDNDLHYGGSSERVDVYDLRTGKLVTTLGGQVNQCEDYSYGCNSEMNDLVINSQGFTAVHATVLGNGQSEQIIASDSGGIHVLDSTQSIIGDSALTNLALKGDTLAWQHDGQPRTAQLG